MRVLGGSGVLGVLVAAALIGAPAASASIEAGDDCVANTAEGIFTLVPIARVSPSPLPLTTPVGGVVTSWKVNSGVTEPVLEQMRVMRSTGSSSDFRVIGESDEGLVSKGANVFPTRIPVQPGDRFGVFGTVQDVVYCFPTGNEGDVTGGYLISAAVGSTHTFFPVTEVRVAMIAVIEPDADGDGYGDETQDKCPTSAATQGECPTLALDAFPIVLKQSILLLVGASSETTVTVTGQAQWGFKPKPKSPRRSKAKLIIGLHGGTQTVRPGAVAHFTVKLPKLIKQRLLDLPPSKSVKVTLNASAKDPAGRLSARTITVRLKGREASG
jgi:hypothetical protein